MEYLEFIDLKYVPEKNDLICLFKVEPATGLTMKEVAGRVASESSVGTWTKSLSTETPRVATRLKKLSAKVFEIKNNFVKIAYPSELFEPGNMPQILSSIAGNIFGMKAVQNLRLEDIQWPQKIITSFKGPQFGSKGIREIFKVKERPLTATVPKPKVGLTSEEYARVGYEAWMGGVDMLKDDENLSSQSFNKFEQRADLVFKMRDKVEKETGEKKSYLVNITAETKEMQRRAKLVADYGNEYVMIDIITAGWSCLQTLRDECSDLKLAIHAHRAFHSTFTRNPNHGVSMLVVSSISRLIGVDNLHVGTVIGKLVSPKKEVLMLKDELTKQIVEKGEHRLTKDWANIKPVFPVSSGGLHPGLIPEVLEILGNNIILQLGGGIHGHLSGTRAGAKAMRQAIDASMENNSLENYSKTHVELKEALEQWGHKKTR